MRLPTIMGVALLGLMACGCATTRTSEGGAGVRSPKELRQLASENRDRLVGETVPKNDVLRRMYTIFIETPLRWWEIFQGRTPLAAARKMEDSTSADNRREGIFTLDDYTFGRKEPYLKRYHQIADNDSSTMVRAAAIRALNRSRDKSASEIFIRSLGHADPLIRLEAAKALSNLPDEKAIQLLIAHMGQDQNRDVRIACTDALRLYKTKEVARALIGMLLDRDFGVAFQARLSLNLLTFRDFMYDDGAWANYLSSNPQPFVQ